MARVYAGSDGSFLSGWQMWKRRNKSYERLVIAHEDVVVFRNTDDSANQEYVCYTAIEESELPEGVKLTGHTIRDNRPE